LRKWSEADLVSLTSQRYAALWIIAYGLERFYLTNEEKEYLLRSLENGARFVEIKGNILTDKFLYITLDDDKYSGLKRQSRPQPPEPSNISDEQRRTNIEKLRELKERGI